MEFSVIGKKFFCACVIASGVLTACVSETPSAGNEEPGVNPPLGLYRMSFNASEGKSPSSRASVDEGSMNGGAGTASVFRWDAGDRVMIWTGGNATHLTPCLFEIEEGGQGFARFDYEGEKVDSRMYFGYYPYAENLNFSHVDITVPTDGSIVQTAADNSRHLGAYRPMYTSVITRNTDESELTGLAFRPLTGLLYFRILNESGAEARIESITIRSSEKVFSDRAVLQFAPETPETDARFEVVGTSLSESTTLSLGETKQGLTLADGKILQAFLPVLPVESLAGTRLTLVLKADGHDHTSLELNGDEVKAFEKAKYYRFGLRLKHNGIELEPVIGDWEPGEDIDVPVV